MFAASQTGTGTPMGTVVSNLAANFQLRVLSLGRAKEESVPWHTPI